MADAGAKSYAVEHAPPPTRDDWAASAERFEAIGEAYKCDTASRIARLCRTMARRRRNRWRDCG